jgi:hypothetical protein
VEEGRKSKRASGRIAKTVRFLESGDLGLLLVTAATPPLASGSGAVVMPLQQALVGGTRKSLLLALGIVVFVLLIASSNVAILMLARVADALVNWLCEWLWERAHPKSFGTCLRRV